MLGMKNLIRLNRAIAQLGFASRRKADEMIFNKRVEVNGRVIDNPATSVDIDKDKIRVDGESRKKKTLPSRLS